MDESLRKRLGSQIAKGDAILFTGAGFSLGNVSKAGFPIPTTEELRMALWEIAFPGEAIDRSPIGDVYRAAQRTAGNKTRDLLDERLVVDPAHVPLHFGVWFRQPWRRAYTLNIDNLDQAVDRTFQLPRALEDISALADPVPSETPKLQSIHLNGRVADFPDVTFSTRDYARRSIQGDPWYDFLAAEILTRPVVFAGTVLDESPLWHHVELRRTSRSMKGAPLPGSYLVTPSLPLARRRLLEEFNITFVEMTAEEFALDVLQSLGAAAEEGLRRIHVLRNPEAYRGSALRPLSELKTVKVEDLSSFLLGREPEWADLLEGFAVSRQFETELLTRILEEGSDAALLTGTAGSGKSTSLQRLALEADAAGLDVHVVDRDSGDSLRSISQAIATTDPDVVIVDDMEVYGEAILDFVMDVCGGDEGPLLLGAMKGTRFESLRIQPRLEDEGVKLRHTTVPLLQDGDIDALLDALDAANRLGRLKNLSREAQRQEFEVRCGRQLLVAMIETTSGEDFVEKIRRECGELEPPLSSVYPVACLATSQDVGLTREELIMAVPVLSPEEAHYGVERLRAQHLLIRRGELYYVRHAVVAGESLRHYQVMGHIREPLTGLLKALAIRWSPELSRNHRINRLLARLLSHDFMARITDSNETPRIAYTSVEDLLRDSHHYWLQRGNYELDHGNLDLAHNYLDQAKQIAPNDSFVIVSWAHKTLRRAADNPSAESASDRAEDAIRELIDVISRRGHRDYTPYHVLGSQGLHWFRRAVIPHDERAQQYKWLLEKVKQGSRRHPHSREMGQLEADLERAYLELALPPDSRST